MKRIFYSSGSVVTTDRVAEAVIEYAQQLARGETSDAVMIPVIAGDGSAHEARLLLGPASQLAAVDEEEHVADVRLEGDVEEAAIEALRARIASLHHVAVPVDDVDLRATDPYDA